MCPQIDLCKAIPVKIPPSFLPELAKAIIKCKVKGSKGLGCFRKERAGRWALVLSDARTHSHEAMLIKRTWYQLRDVHIPNGTDQIARKKARTD